MGPWAIRDPLHPFRPGCSFETIRKLAATGRITPTTVMRGPTTRQSWLFAGRTPAVANLLGLCHNCQREANPDARACPACGASFLHEADRQFLGLAPVHLLPGQASPESIASAAAPKTEVTPDAASAAAERSEPDVAAILTATRRHIGRLRAIVAILILVSLGIGAALAAVLAGWRPFAEQPQRLEGRPSSAAQSPPSVLPEGPAQARDSGGALPAASEPAPPPPQVPPAEDKPADPPAVDPVEPPVAVSPSDSSARRERVLELLAGPAPDHAAALAECDALAAADPSFDASQYRRLIELRTRWALLRSLP